MVYRKPPAELEGHPDGADGVEEKVMELEGCYFFRGIPVVNRIDLEIQANENRIE